MMKVFNAVKFQSLYLKWICDSDSPLSTGERDTFKELMAYALAAKVDLASNFMSAVPSGTTVTRKLLLLYEEFKKQIKRYFSHFKGIFKIKIYLLYSTD
jgi:hypothetical protein